MLLNADQAPKSEYNRIIDYAKKESDTRRMHMQKGLAYFEGHHIIPRALGGLGSSSSWTHDNVVHLTPEEHFTCHYLLCLINPNSYEIANAFCFMWSGEGVFKQYKTSKNLTDSVALGGFTERLDVYTKARIITNEYRNDPVKDNNRLSALKIHNAKPETKQAKSLLRQKLNKNEEFKKDSSKRLGDYMKSKWLDPKTLETHTALWSKECSVLGVLYKSAKAAAEALQLSHANMLRRINSPRYIDYYFTNQKNK